MAGFIERRSKQRAPKKDIVVIYHGNCTDGFSGAWAAWKKLGKKAEYIGVQHHTLPPLGLTNKELYFIDFVYPEKIMRKLIKTNKKVTAIDHHVSAEKTIKLTQDYLYSIKHSGAVLAWKYFHPNKPVPRLLKHVEDTDLWKFKLPHTKEIFAYLELFDFAFKTWDKLAKDLENSKKRKQYVEKGRLILRYEEKQVERLVSENSEKVNFEGHDSLAVNSPVLVSKIGASLVKKKPPIGIIWQQKQGKKIVSLRSNGKTDVAKLAKKYGGGGHKAASAFAIDASKKLPWEYKL